MKMRHSLRLSLRCPVIFASDELVGEGTVVDLGVPGCAVESDIAPPPGEYVRLHVLMPDEKGPLEVGLAKVRWAKPAVVRGGVSQGLQRATGGGGVGRLFRALLDYQFDMSKLSSRGHLVQLTLKANGWLGHTEGGTTRGGTPYCTTLSQANCNLLYRRSLPS
jgi:hypothetical protein